MEAREKQTLLWGGGAAALYLVYRWQKNGSLAAQQQAGTQTGAAVDPGSAQYAALAGQEQSDMAAMQSQNQQLLATEQSDVQNLSSGMQQQAADWQGLFAGQTAALTGFQGQEQSDVAGLAAQIGSTVAQASQSALAAISPAVQNVTHQVAAVAAGQQAVSRATTISTHPGGAFYNWYKSIYHRAPPAVVNNANPIYLAWQKGTNKATVHKNNPRGIR